MNSRTTKRKRVSDSVDQEWAKPANVPKELRDCVASLASTVDTVSVFSIVPLPFNSIGYCYVATTIGQCTQGCDCRFRAFTTCGVI